MRPLGAQFPKWTFKRKLPFEMHENLDHALLAIEQSSPKLGALLKQKLRHPHQLVDWALCERGANRSIATVNGCFDLLHLGHLHILVESKAQADTLLLAINTDCAISARKGKTRPVCKLHERLLQTAALQCVDFVTYFCEPTPISLIELVRPDVHVNGAEYGIDCIESKAVKSCGGRLHLIDSIKGYSTTSLIEKLKKGAS